MCTVEGKQGYHVVAHGHMYLTKQVMLQATHSVAHVSILVRVCRFVSKRAEPVARSRVNDCAQVMHVCRKSIARAVLHVAHVWLSGEWAMNLAQAGKMDLHVLSRVLPVSHVSREAEPIARPRCGCTLHMWCAEHL